MGEISELDKEIRHMQASYVLDLCNILDCNDSWKSLMSLIKEEGTPGSAKYSMEHIRLIESASDKQRRSCSEILLEEWGTSGKVRPRFSSLLKYLIDAQLFRAAEYVHSTLLRREEPLARPSFGPAAAVKIPNMINFDSSKSNSDHVDVTLVNNIQSSSQSSNELETGQGNRPIISVTVPCSKLSDYPKEFKFNDLKLWTENFARARCLGHGAFGSVYLCHIPEMNAKVAVKRLQINNNVAPLNHLPTQFHNEIATLTMFQHDNVLSLLGYSTDGPDLCLVYDYMPNGSLEDKIKEGSKDFEWILRLEISRGTASGIHYLHTFSEKPHIHRDIKSANILLDENLIPKLGDFGLARPAPLETIATTTIVGTTAYMSPEALRGDISIKMDVFSFGVVLLEIVTGLLAWDEARESRSLVSYIDDINDIDCLIDRRPENPEDDLALNIFNVSQKCIHEKKRHRPTMEQVLEMLLNISPHNS